MQELFTTKSIDELTAPGEAFCVTTNGVVENNGCLVMGAGLAKYVRDRYPNIDKTLGLHVSIFGNTPCIVHLGEQIIISLPTKYHWKGLSNIDLIKKSCEKLVDLIDIENIPRVYMPRPGCGLGALSWETEVKPAIENILDDRFIVIYGYAS